MLFIYIICIYYLYIIYTYYLYILYILFIYIIYILFIYIIYIYFACRRINACTGNWWNDPDTGNEVLGEKLSILSKKNTLALPWNRTWDYAGDPEY